MFVKKSWWRRRWDVFEVVLEDIHWVASFASEENARAWAER